jgi:hypothetical protein
MIGSLVKDTVLVESIEQLEDDVVLNQESHDAIITQTLNKLEKGMQRKSKKTVIYQVEETLVDKKVLHDSLIYELKFKQKLFIFFNLRSMKTLSALCSTSLSPPSKELIDLVHKIKCIFT